MNKTELKVLLLDMARSIPDRSRAPECTNSAAGNVDHKPFIGPTEAAASITGALFQRIRELDNASENWRANAALWEQRWCKATRADPTLDEEHFRDWEGSSRYEAFFVFYTAHFRTLKLLWEIVRESKQKDEYVYWYFGNGFTREQVEAFWDRCKHAAYPDLDSGYDPDGWNPNVHIEMNF